MAETLKMEQSKRERERVVNSCNFLTKNSFRFVFFFLIISGSFLILGGGWEGECGYS